MRSILTALIATVSAIVLLSALGQDPDDEKKPLQDTGRAPFSEMRKKRIAELEKGLEGGWILNRVELPGSRVQRDDFSGFLVFQDGLLASQMLTTQLGGVFGTSARRFVQAGVHRYRIDDQGQLQMANLQSFSNMNSGADLVLNPPPIAQQYEASLEANVLTLRRVDGALLMFNRVGRGQFPEEAVNYLRSTGGGKVPLPPDPTKR